MIPYYFTYLKRLVGDGRIYARYELTDRHGGLLCKAGEALNHHAWDEMTKLSPPDKVLSSIKIGGEYTKQSLEADFLSVLQSDRYLAEFYNPEQHAEMLRANVRFVCAYTDLVQHLTLLNTFLPDAFARAVFCAWFASLIYREAETEEMDIRNIFLAALCHDIGLLHIDPVLLQEQNATRNADYYKHVEIAVNILDKLPGISQDTVRAVMEHHEHLDGSGHPRGLGSNQLSHAGQYIHLLDNLYQLYLQHFQSKGKSLCDTIPIVEMNSISHFGHTAKATITILQRGTRTEGTLIPPDILKSLVEDIKTRYNYIIFANNIIQQFTNSVGFRHDDKALFMLQNSMIHVALTLDKSKLLNPAYMRWLDHVIEFNVKREHHLIEVSYLMTNEVLFHIEKFRNQLALYRRFCKLKNVIPHVDHALKSFQAHALPH